MVASSLELELYSLFASGVLSGAHVQKLASCAWSDGWGWKDPTVSCRLRDAEALDDAVSVCTYAFSLSCWGTSEPSLCLVKAGSFGKHLSNIQRDLFSAAESNGIVDTLPREYIVSARGPGGEPRKHEIYLTHETIAYYEAKCGDDLHLCSDDLMTTPIGALVREWCGHSDVQVPLDKATQVVPIGFHGDGVQYTTTMRAGSHRHEC